MVGPGLRECYTQSRAEMVSYNRNKIHSTWDLLISKFILLSYMNHASLTNVCLLRVRRWRSVGEGQVGRGDDAEEDGEADAEGARGEQPAHPPPAPGRR